MTREEKIKAFEMRLDGMTFQEIGDHFGVTRQCIEGYLKPNRTRKKPYKNFKCIYPGLKKWMLENCVSVMTMHDDLHLYANHPTLYRFMKGKALPTMDVIKKILAYTGLTFEEAFGQVEDAPGGDPNDSEQQAEGSAV